MSGRAVRAVQGSEGEGVVKRVRRTNAPWGVEVEKCAYLPCDRPRESMQLCGAHYSRMTRGSSIAVPVREVWELTTDRTCDVDGCGRPHLALGYCRLHYDRSRSKYAVDIEVIEMDVFAGIEAERIAADQGVPLFVISRFLRSNGRSDLAEALIRGAA